MSPPIRVHAVVAVPIFAMTALIQQAPFISSFSVSSPLLVPAATASNKKISHDNAVMPFSCSSRMLPVMKGAEGNNDDGDNDVDMEYLKTELDKYLQARKEAKADDAAKSEAGKTVGGSRDNPVLEYISVVPKAMVLEEPNVFDYGELTKYGFQYLVNPIMKAGGRQNIYPLMGMTPPALPDRLKPKKVPELVIDREGSTDPARYTGLKMGQALFDDDMGEALQKLQQKENNEKKKLIEQEYIQPFSDKRNTSPRGTVEWTPAMLDEEGRKQGRTETWARKSKEGEFARKSKSDAFETVQVEGSLRLYCMFASVVASFAFGKSSPLALTLLLSGGSGTGVDEASVRNIIDVLQIPGLVVLLAAFGSAVVSSVVIAPKKERSSFVWGFKGLLGGPVALFQLQSLNALEK